MDAVGRAGLACEPAEPNVRPIVPPATRSAGAFGGEASFPGTTNARCRCEHPHRPRRFSRRPGRAATCSRPCWRSCCSGRSRRRCGRSPAASCRGTRRTISIRCCAISARRWRTANCRSGTRTISAAIRRSPIRSRCSSRPTMLLFAWLVPVALDAAVRRSSSSPTSCRARWRSLALFRRRGWHPAGAVVAAMIFMLGGSAAARLQHTGMIFSYGVLPPLALLAARRAPWTGAPTAAASCSPSRPP